MRILNDGVALIEAGEGETFVIHGDEHAFSCEFPEGCVRTAAVRVDLDRLTLSSRHGMSEFGVDALAKLCEVSPTMLKEPFRDTFGMPIGDVVSHLPDQPGVRAPGARGREHRERRPRDGVREPLQVLARLRRREGTDPVRLAQCAEGRHPIKVLPAVHADPPVRTSRSNFSSASSAG